VIDIKQIFKNAEFVGNPANRAKCRGKVCMSQGYQQSCPQFLGVRLKPHKNQGLSAVFVSNSCGLCAGQHTAIALAPMRAPQP
jgi:hypothetical protein